MINTAESRKEEEEEDLGQLLEVGIEDIDDFLLYPNEPDIIEQYTERYYHAAQ